jgi:hypothetical protein
MMPGIDFKRVRQQISMEQVLKLVGFEPTQCQFIEDDSGHDEGGLFVPVAAFARPPGTAIHDPGTECPAGCLPPRNGPVFAVFGRENGRKPSLAAASFEGVDPRVAAGKFDRDGLVFQLQLSPIDRLIRRERREGEAVVDLGG